jgi:type II secretory pathway predicted ATPase ExeA
MTSPFREPATDAFFVPGPTARAAELKLAFAVEQGVEVGLLIGDPGLGKTTLLRRAAAHAAGLGHVVADLFFPRLGVDELLAFLDAELSGAASASGEGREARVRRVAERVRRFGEEGHGVVVTIDDAHLLRDPAVFEALHLLLNLREREGASLTFLLAGGRGLVADLAKVPAFAQRVAVTATLAPLGRDETAGYVHHRLAAAGFDRELFDDAALDAVHDGSCGVPRAVNRLCDVVLLIAGAESRDRVLRRDVDAALHECPAFGREAA